MSEDPREALLDVARDIVAKRGYVGLTMRTASAAVGVTPDVARRYYRNREALFAAAMRLPADPVSAIPTLMAPGIEGMGERLVRFTLDTLRDPGARDDLMSLARTGVAAGHAVTALQDFVEVDVVDRVATMIGVPDARMRSALISSYLLGVATMRYGVRLEPLASASDEEVIRMVAPVIQDLLDPRRPIPGSARARLNQQADARQPVPPPATTSKRRFDPDPAATRAKQAARLAAEAARARAGTDQAPGRHAAEPGAAPGTEPAPVAHVREPAASGGGQAASKAASTKRAATSPRAPKPKAEKAGATKVGKGRPAAPRPARVAKPSAAERAAQKATPAHGARSAEAPAKQRSTPPSEPGSPGSQPGRTDPKGDARSDPKRDAPARTARAGGPAAESVTGDRPAAPDS